MKENLTRKQRVDLAEKLDREIEVANKNGQHGIALDLIRQKEDLEAPLLSRTPSGNINEVEPLEPEETFGQPIVENPATNPRARKTSQVISGEPEKNPDVSSGPQKQASEQPEAPPQLHKSVKQKPFGGWARRIFRRGSKTPEGVNEVSSGEDGAAGVAAGSRLKGKGLQEKAIAAIKKIAGPAIKKIAVSFAANPYVWLIVGGSIGALIILIVALSLLGLISSKKPSTTGGTPPVYAEPQKDWNKIEHLLKLSGEQDITSQEINSSLDEVQANLKKMEDDVTLKSPANKDTILLKIAEVKNDVDVLRSDKTKDRAITLLTDLGSLYDLFEDPFPVYAGITGLPVRNVNQFVTNISLHGKSFLRPEADAFNNVYVSDDDNNARCDALDLGVTADSASDDAKATVYPIFNGRIETISDDGAGGKMVLVSDGDWKIVYIHLEEINKNTGEQISISEPLGTAKGANIQLEFIYKNKCLVTTHGDMINHGMQDRKSDSWGDYLWERVKVKFKLGT